jgi:MFS family permease
MLGEPLTLRDILADTRPLKTPAFRRVWLADIVTVVGAQLTVVAVPAQIYAQTRSSMYVGLTGIFGLVPLVVFGLYGGALADTFDRRTIQLVTTCGLVAMSAVFCVQAALGGFDVWILLGMFALQQAIFAVDQPTKSAIVPRLVPMDEVPAANALLVTVYQVGAIAGPLLGGVLIPVTGFAGLYLLDVLGLLATLWAVLRLPALRVEGATAGGAPGIGAVVDGLSYIATQPILLMSFLVDTIAMVFGMPRALFPEVAHTAFHGPTDGGLAFALLFAAIPAGAAAGGVLSGWVTRIRAQGRAVVYSIIAWGVCIALFGLAVTWAPHAPGAMLAAAVILLALAGMADLASASLRRSILQTAATDAMRGRLQGVFLVVVAGGPRIADTVHGVAAGWVGTAATITGGGLLVIVLVLVSIWIAPSFIRYRVAARPTTSPSAAAA